MDCTHDVGLLLVRAAVGLVALNLALLFSRPARPRRRARKKRIMPVELVDGNYLAKLLAVSAETIERWGLAGKIPRIVLSKKMIRYDLDAVLESLGLSREKLGLSPLGRKAKVG